MVDAIESQPIVILERVETATAEVRELIRELDDELSAHYEAEQRHGLTVEGIFQPHMRFFVARINEVAAGCGGIALGSQFAEIKRMYVRTGARGRGVADAIIDRLTAEAQDAGLSILRLETGVQQVAALRFYERCGFRRCSAFGAYSSMPPQAVAASVFMEKRISGAKHDSEKR